MNHVSGRQEELESVPLFPLPNVVLFPRAVIPLHIFEQRYKAMTAEILAGKSRIAMALLKPGWEKNYYQRPAIDSIVCVGRILSSEKLPDGNYNLLLQGTARARIVRELDGRPYRLAVLKPLDESAIIETDLDRQRQQLLTMFGQGPIRETAEGQLFRRVLAMPCPQPM